LHLVKAKVFDNPDRCEVTSMKKNFSSSELFELRNAIPMDMLIKDGLRIPSKVSDDVFRFLCPICNEFQTSVNPATNLARCFRCEKNFNTIDLVMSVRRSGFKESILFLKQMLGKVPNQDASQALNAFTAEIGQMPGGLK